MTVPTSEPRINAIGTAVPAVECDASYHAWALRQLDWDHLLLAFTHNLQVHLCSGNH